MLEGHNVRGLRGWRAITTCLLVAGCASVPRLPTDFSLARTAVVAGAAEPQVAVDGPAGKGNAAAGGATKGGGIGLVFAGLACGASGPFAPLCIAALVPTGVVVGAVGGAAIAAYTADSAGEVEAKRMLLQSALAASNPQVRLVSHLGAQARELAGIDLQSGDSADAVVRQPWALRVAVAELATAGSGADVPYALQVSADVNIDKAGGSQHVFVKRYQATSARKLTTPQWALNAAEVARAELDSLLGELAVKMVQDLAPAGTRPKKREGTVPE
jgi:hypothetical protein